MDFHPLILMRLDSSVTLIGFDFGTRKIGVAIGQTLTKTATVLPPISAIDGTPNQQALQKLVNDWQPDLFIVGSPINMDGSDSDMSARAQTFCNYLQQEFKKPCHLFDERLTTFEAKEQLDIHYQDLYASSRSKKKYWQQKQRQWVDSISAKLIVESWLRQNS